jgi:NADH-quinone oxidoreductase subunit M
MSPITALALLPVLGALLIALVPTEKSLRIKQITLGVTVSVAAFAIYIATQFVTSDTKFQFTESHEWIPAFGINYSVGIDGLSLVLILMSVLLVPIVVLACWNESEGGRWSAKVFYILILILETMMIGVFVATDVFLFYVIFEAMLIPVYFLIGGYGSGERAAAAVKFLI